MVVISVVGFGIFRGLQIRRSRNIEGVRRRDTMNNSLIHERLFTVQSVIADLDHGTPIQKIEEDLVIQDIELDSLNSPSRDHSVIS